MKSITPVTATAILIDETADLIPKEEPPTAPMENNASSAANGNHQHQTFHENGGYMVPITPHPPNAPSGGVWGKQHFRGPLTAAATVGGVLVACFPGLLMLIFRLDRRDAYLAPNGFLYDVQGKKLGDAKKLEFVAERPMMVATKAVQIE